VKLLHTAMPVEVEVVVEVMKIEEEDEGAACASERTRIT
jgi:hypothetical protein